MLLTGTLAYGWGNHYLKSERKRVGMAVWYALEENEYAHLNIAVSETHFLGVLVKH